MFKNNLKLAWRNLLKNKASSLINVGGLAIGMAVVMLIGLWVYDEISFDKYHKHYDRIAQVLETQGISGALQTQTQIPIPVATVLRNKFGSDFKQILLSSQTQDHILTFKENKLSKTGNFMEPQAPELLTLQMLEGSRNGLSDMHSIILSASLSKALFGAAGALGQTIRMDDSLLVKVTGIYQDLPQNSSFHDLAFIAPWDLYVYADQETRNSSQQWQDNNWQVFVQLADHADLPSLSAKIKNIKADNDDYLKTHHNAIAQMLLQPMSKWHLYADFKDGVNTGGRIQYIRLFALIGIFVLLLACINFMNLSTARSEKRAKEVGIRKAMGSVRAQLIIQFFSESILVVAFAFILSLGLVALSLPWFNEVAGKQIGMPLGNTTFWLLAVAFILITGLIAGSYPAFYLSSFQPVKVLKGVFRTGRQAALPRKVLVVAQFTVSMVLIIGTIIVFRQIQFARNRPIGYNRQGLVTIDTHTKVIYDHFTAFRNDLLATGAITEVAESTAPTTEMRNSQNNFSWTGKDPKNDLAFATVGVNEQYAQTIGLKFMAGRNFRTDPSGYDAVTMIITESAAKQMGFKHPIGENIQWMGAKFTVVGVVKDMIMNSPYDPEVPTIFYVAPWIMNTVTFRINPRMAPTAALQKIAPVFARYNPAEPFDYHFVDLTYDAKFRAEQRVGQLAGIFAGLAIFVSCLGLFGLASFMAEQRAKEIGVRKVLGATVFNLWGMLSKDFVGLVGLSCVLAIPIAWYALHNWLQQYAYHTAISWWIFMITAVGAVLITLVTVSYQSIKAALINPVKSLRSE